MKYLCIQLQPELNEASSKEEALAALSKTGYVFEVSEGEDKGKYINFIFKSNDLKETWNKINTHYIAQPNLSASSIITCEGSKGWDNYLLLHHFDKNVEIDEL
jgi:hypothetical protein